MDELIKIRDVSSKYNITARALRYYEDIGLLSSTRSDEVAYRMYDENAIRRLEQILILRKLNISIKDIQRIFAASGSEVVLEVLGKKVANIDEELSLLNELKNIVLDFIDEIEKMNFSKNSDIKQLYDKAKEIETQIVNVDYIGKPANVSRLMEITDKLDKKVPDVMVVRIPEFKVVTSGKQSFEEIFKRGGYMFQLWRHYTLYKPVIFDCLDFLLLHEDKGEMIDLKVAAWASRVIFMMAGTIIAEKQLGSIAEDENERREVELANWLGEQGVREEYFAKE